MPHIDTTRLIYCYHCYCAQNPLQNKHLAGNITLFSDVTTVTRDVTTPTF